MYNQINDNLDFSSHAVKNLECKSLDEYENLHLTLKYTPRSKLGHLSSRACFNCYYPRNGHVLDIPRPLLADEDTETYKEKCLRPIID